MTPNEAPVACAIHCAQAASCAACGCWTAALPSRIAARVPLTKSPAIACAAAPGVTRGDRRRDALEGGDGRRDFHQRLQPHPRSDDLLVRHRHQQFIVDGVHQRDPAATLDRVAHARCQQRMVLAQERSDQQHTVAGTDVSHLHAEPRRAAALAVGGKIALAQAEVDVLRPEAAHQLAQQVELLERAVRRGERADGAGAVLCLHALQGARHVLERDAPVDLLPGAVLLEHRARQAIGRVDALVGEAVAVRQPALVDRLVLQRQHAQHAVILDLHDEVRAEAVVAADRLAPRQLPGAGGVAERLARQRADRTEVDHVAGDLGIDRGVDERQDLRVLAAPGHAEFHDPGDLLAEAHATRAVDAAAHLLGGNQRAEVLVKDDALGLVVARGRAAVADRQILQLALAALVADRAVERVIDQQEFHHRLLRLPRLGRDRAHDHAVGDRRGAGRHRLGRLLDLDQAHAAVGRDRQLLVVAEVRHVDVERIRGLHDHAALGHRDLLAVDFELDCHG